MGIAMVDSRFGMGYQRNICKREYLLKAIDSLDVSISKSPQIYANILQGCVVLNGLAEGRCVHMHMSKIGLEGNMLTSNKLINMYAKCGSVIDAQEVFNRMTLRNVISWTAIIAGYAQHGLGNEAFKFFQEMKKGPVTPNRVTFLCILDACDGLADLDKGKLVHADIVDNGMDLNIMLGTALVNMYGKCCSIEDACDVFDRMGTRDVILWTAMITVYTQHGHGKEAVELFKHMECQGVEPNEFTFSSILCVCGSLVDLMQGKRVHMLLAASKIEIDGFVGASLVSMYAKCGSVQEAHEVFKKLGKRDLASWTALITGYAHRGFAKEALILFQQMRLEGLKSDVVVGNALIDLFAKCGNLNDARKVFDKMSQKDVISWSTLISGYTQQGFNKEALELYWQMLVQRIFPDKYTVSSILGACANLAALDEGKEIHVYIIEFELELDTFVRNALVNMYAKCGTMEDASSVFNGVFEPDVVSWNAMILGYGQHGYGKAAFNIFHEVLKEGLEPDEFTFSGVLSACASLGMLAEGKEVHNHIIRTGFEVNNVIGNALVDMYATCGSVQEAFAVFNNMSGTDVISWSSMIGGWAQHGYGKEALSLYQQMQQEGMKPDEFTFSSILIACSHTGLVEEGWYCFKSMIQGHVIIPTLEHYASMVDLLGRSGCLYEAVELIYRMPIHPHCAVWMSLLAACRNHDNVQLAEDAAEHAFDLGPGSAGAYVLLSNIYTVVDKWND